MIELKDIVKLFCEVSETKEETFLKGFLMGLGSHSPCPTPNWELIKEYPDSVEIEREMREMFEKIQKSDIQEAQRLLAEYRGNENRVTQRWLQSL